MKRPLPSQMQGYLANQTSPAEGEGSGQLLDVQEGSIHLIFSEKVQKFKDRGVTLGEFILQAPA